MEYLGGFNLFTSHFIIGCKEVNREFTKTETIEIEALHKWLEFKDNDWGMNRYRTDRTQYIDFLEIIELKTFKEITKGLYHSYCKEYPHSTKKDFINHIFGYTIYDLEKFLNLNLYFIGVAPNENNYSFYTVYSNEDREFLDFAINNKFEIEHYKQYYKVVLEYLKTFENENTQKTGKEQLETLSSIIIHKEAEKPKPEPKETELSEKIKTHFGFFNGNCPRKHKKILNDTDFEKLIKWTIWYFENSFDVPEISEPIKVVNTNKTFVQLAFKYLFKQLHKSSPYPETLFEFYQSAFTPYSEDRKRNFEAVKNNDEVKKLMQIDY